MDAKKKTGNATVKKVVGTLLEKREVSLVILLILAVLALMTRTDKFATMANFRVLLNGMSTDMMIAIPMAISLIAGNTDFSVGSSLCFSSMIAGLAMANGAPPVVGILVGLGMGAVLGFINGLIVNKLRVTPLVATLGTWYAYVGLAQAIAGTQSITRFEPGFLQLGRFEIGGVTAPIIYMVIMIIVGHLALKYVNFFHNAYYIGSNKNSARLAGINNTLFTYVAYTITGMVCAFSGLVLMARLGSVSIVAGNGLEFRNVVALLIGGVSMDGGEGSVIGAVLGVLFMQIVDNALVLLYIDTAYNKVIIGLVLVLAVALDQYTKARRTSAHS